MAEQDDLVFRVGIELSNFVKGVSDVIRGNAALNESTAKLTQHFTQNMGKMDKIAQETTASIAKSNAEAATKNNAFGQNAAILAENIRKASEKIVNAQKQIAVEEERTKRAQEKTLQTEEKRKMIQKMTLLERAKTANLPTLLAIEEAKANTRRIESENRVKIAQIRANKEIEKAKIRAAEANRRATKTLIQQVNTILRYFTKAVSLFRTFGSAVLGAVRPVISMASAIGNLGKKLISLTTSPLRNAINGFKEFWNRVASVASGVLLRDVIFGVMNSIKELANSAVEGAKDIQNALIRLDTMSRRQFGLANQEFAETESVEYFSMQAQEAQKNADGLLKTILALSKSQPVDFSVIASTTAFGMAMGFADTEALQLSKSVAQYTAALGLGSEVTERIILNFGQMKAQGKLASTELRDLARGAFFPLTDVINRMGENLGIAAQDMTKFRADVAAGKVDINEFFKAFQELVERDMAGVLEKFKNTLEGVTIRVQNFIKTVIGTKLLGPIVQRVIQRINAALDVLFSDRTIELAGLIGEALAYSFDRISNALGNMIDGFTSIAKAMGLVAPEGVDIVRIFLSIGRVIEWLSELFKQFAEGVIVPFINRFSKTMGGGLDEIAGRAFKWGGNIIYQLASGMIRGGTQFLVAAMNWLSSMLRKWLAPGSPPLVAPQIDVWGKETMIEWLKGFTSADFDVLDSIQGRLGSALSLLVQKGLLSASVADNAFVAISEQLIGAISEFETYGDVGGAIFETLAAIGGNFGKELSALLEKQFDLVRGIKWAEEAQRRLNAAQEKVKTTRRNVAMMVKEYNKLLRAGVSQAELQSRLASINAEEIALDTAKKEQAVAEQVNEEAQAALKPLEEKVKLQEKLIDQLLELVRIQTAGGGGGGGADEEEGFGALDMSGLGFTNVPDPEKFFPSFDEIVGAWEGSFNRALEQIRRNFWIKIGQLRAEWNEGVSSLSEPWKELGNSVRDAWNALTDWWETDGLRFAAQIMAYGVMIGYAIGRVFDTVIANLTGKDVDELTLEDRLNALAEAITAIVAGVAGLVALVGGIIAGITRSINWGMDLWNKVIAWGEDNPLYKAMQQVLEDATKSIQDGWQKIVDAFTGGKSWDQILSEIVTGIGQILAGIVASIIASIISMVLRFITYFMAIWASILGFVSGFVTGIWDFFVGLYNDLVGHSLIPDMLNKMKELFRKGLDWIKKKWDDIWQKVYDFIDGIFNDPDGIVQRITKAIGDLKTLFAETLTNALNTFKTNVLDPLALAFTAVKDAISGVVSWLGELAAAVLSFDLGKLMQLLGGIFGGGTTSGGTLNSGSNTTTRTTTSGTGSGSGGTPSIPTLNQVVQAPPVHPTTAVNVVFENVNVSSPIDMVTFEASVERAITRRLR